MAEGEVPLFCLLPVDVGENGSIDSGCTGTCDVFSTRACDATSAQDLRAPDTLCGGGSNLLCGGDSAPISATGFAPLCVGSLDVISGEGDVSQRACVPDQRKEELVSLGESSTKQKDNWARKKFDEWRKICGLECQVPLEKLDLRQLNDMLSQFFVVVCKQNGSLFPSDTLMGMLRCFGRMIKKEQELRVALTGVTEVPFDIVKNPIFKSTQNAVISAMRRSVARGVCKERKKSSVLGITLEQEILRDIDFNIQHSRGCQSRFAFFCMLHFCVRGGLELYKLERAMFARGADELGPFVRFSERLSKNYKVDLMHYQPEHFRPPVTVRDSDVLDTFDQLMRHMPPIVEGDKNLLHVFLQPISSPRTQTWYSRNRVSVKVLSGLVKFICERSGVGGNFSNKSLRSTSVTRMSLGQVPPDVGMLVTGHKRATSYEKYDLSSEVRIAAAQDILSHPYDDSGKLKAYPQVLKEKFNNFCQNVEGASRDIREDVCPLSAGLLSVGSVDNNVGGESKSKISCGHLSNSVDKVASGKSKLKSSDGICFGSYKLGDDIPFDEKLLQDLPPESARAVGIVPRSPGVSMFPSCNMHNCVVNVYLGKENTLPVPSHIQQLRCKCNFHALNFLPDLQDAAALMISRMREQDDGWDPMVFEVKKHDKANMSLISQESNLNIAPKQRALAFDNYFQNRMGTWGFICDLRSIWSHTPCVTLVEENLKSANWICTGRSIFHCLQYFIRRATKAVELRRQGRCPLTPEEAALMLAALGFKRGTWIFLAGTHIFGGQSRMMALTSLFPNVVTKEDLLSEEEMRPFLSRSSKLAALDFIVSAEADAFAMTDSGSQFSGLVAGQRMYHGGGAHPTIRPNRRRLAAIFSRSSNMEWGSFEIQVRKLIREGKRVLLWPRARSLYRHPRCKECMCKVSTINK
ncbi:hypothetical protein GOP47_0005230 [Adiantum capillus-veneris]|uniref:O-fucosyltransferase family protein n=1 Tax=Adiantum capillus-veneris TaxID=13818 RepID=A0A9D4ZNE4_ADICA|nr:hypothetical protein GOP47_0005230 [Adiantum capillus-veneris]